MDILLGTGGESGGIPAYDIRQQHMWEPGTWCIVGNLGIPDTIHPSELDPGEKMWIWATFNAGAARYGSRYQQAMGYMLQRIYNITRRS